MMLYRRSKSKVMTTAGLSEEFEIGVGVHQGSVLSPLLFILVMEEATSTCRSREACGGYCMLMTW